MLENVWNRIRYTVYSPVYDRVAGFGRQRARSIEMLELKQGDRVLILGCGSGPDIPFLPRDITGVAIDITPAMVSRAASRARSSARDIECLVMDGHELQLPSDSFDAVILHLILAVIPDPVACVREAARVLKPGGRAVVFDKFVPDGGRPSLARRIANLPARVLFTDINRQLGPLLAAASLERMHQEPALLGGLFQIALVRKPIGQGRRH